MNIGDGGFKTVQSSPLLLDAMTTTTNLTAITLESYQNRKETCRRFLEQVQGLENTKMTEDDYINLLLMKKEVETYLDGFEFKGYYTPVVRNEDIKTYFEKVVSGMNFRNEEDYEKLFLRFQKFPQQIESFITLMMRHGLQEGRVSHIMVMRKSLDTLAQFIQLSAEATQFYKPFLKLKDLQTISAERKRSIEQRGLQLIKNEILGSFETLVNFLRDEYMLHVRPHLAFSSLPNGEAFYQGALKFHLAYDLTAKEVHDIGLQEVKRIRNDIKKVMERVGYEGSIAEFFEYTRISKQSHFNSQEEIMDEFRNNVERICRELPKYFKTIPDAELRIEEIASSSRSTAYARYDGASLDGKRPGTVFLNCHDPESRSNFQLMALALHEAMPGHHLQFSYSSMMEHWPGFRRCKDERQNCTVPSNFPKHTAYIEGWGMYCEFLGEEMGMYDDPYSLFGRYCMELERACRAVVDTGLHAFQWSKEQVIDYFQRNTPTSRDLIELQVDRFVAFPAQACTYTIGLLKFKELRRKAERQLGEKFDVRDFHEAVLSCGMVPLTVMELLVDKYIERTLKNDN
ncbi:uncharacterized protein [Ptychodera flava]|uniref:uncharacterized protein n=1 Tax=Ptychodera flava TaxID=63121 RepID=UPI00396A3381